MSFSITKSIALLKSHGAEVKIELAAARRGRGPGLNSGSGHEPSSPYTLIFGAIPAEIGPNCSQYSLRAFSFVPLTPSQPQQLHFQKGDMNKAHTNTYSIFYGTMGFLRNHFFLFLLIGFVLIVI